MIMVVVMIVIVVVAAAVAVVVVVVIVMVVVVIVLIVVVYPLGSTLSFYFLVGWTTLTRPIIPITDIHVLPSGEY